MTLSTHRTLPRLYDMNGNLRRCDIGECLPQGESVDKCKARLSRIVAKQKKCYGDSFISETDF